MIAALWSNSSFDDNKGTRKSAIAKIEDSYQEALDAIEAAISSNKELPDERKLSDDNEFFAAAERGLARIDKKIEKHKETPDTDENDDPIDYKHDIDQV